MEDEMKIPKLKRVLFKDFSEKFKVNAVVAVGFGFKRNLTDLADQTKSICSTAVLIAIQQQIPLVLLGQKMRTPKNDQAPDSWLRNETQAMFYYLWGLYGQKEKSIFERIYKIDGQTLFEKIDDVMSLIEKKDWENIAVVCHKDQLYRIKKIFKQLSLIKNMGLTIFLAAIQPAYNGDNTSWWRQGKWRSKIFEKFTGFFNIFSE